MKAARMNAIVIYTNILQQHEMHIKVCKYSQKGEYIKKWSALWTKVAKDRINIRHKVWNKFQTSLTSRVSNPVPHVGVNIHN